MTKIFLVFTRCLRIKEIFKMRRKCRKIQKKVIFRFVIVEENCISLLLSSLLFKGF